MFTKDRNGKRLEVRFAEEPEMFSIKNTPTSSGKVTKDFYEKPEGSNKAILYVALVFGLIVVAGSGYMIFKNYDNEKKKNQTTHFGYSF